MGLLDGKTAIVGLRRNWWRKVTNGLENLLSARVFEKHQPHS